MRADVRLAAVFGLLAAFPGNADDNLESLPRAFLEYLAEWSADDLLLVESPLLDTLSGDQDGSANEAPPPAEDGND